MSDGEHRMYLHHPEEEEDERQAKSRAGKGQRHVCDGGSCTVSRARRKYERIVKAAWSSGMIRPSGGRGPAFDSRSGPYDPFC